MVICGIPPSYTKVTQPVIYKEDSIDIDVAHGRFSQTFLKEAKPNQRKLTDIRLIITDNFSEL